MVSNVPCLYLYNADVVDRQRKPMTNKITYGVTQSYRMATKKYSRLNSNAEMNIKIQVASGTSIGWNQCKVVEIIEENGLSDTAHHDLFPL